jgi:opacity protein-like surface antigen
MRMKLALGIAILSTLSLPAFAQNNHSEIAAAFTGDFQSTASGQNATDASSYSGGLLLNYRYHFNDHFVIEANYARTRYTQFYENGNSLVTSWTQATAQELTLGVVWQFNPVWNDRLTPFVEGGMGGIFWSPIQGGSVGGPFSQNRAGFLYGGGLEHHLFSHFYVRAGYRGIFFTAPDFNQSGQFTNARAQLKEPYAGITFRF